MDKVRTDWVQNLIMPRCKLEARIVHKIEARMKPSNVIQKIMTLDT